MKTFLITTLFVPLFWGCSEHNAFSDFNLTTEQEKSEDSIQSSKIKSSTQTLGIITAVYLNRVNPQKYKDHEYFYIYYYMKDDNQTLEFLLNDKQALKTEALEVQNDFTHLTSVTTEWKRYYLVEFEKKGKNLALEAKSSLLTTDKMIFKKSE